MTDWIIENERTLRPAVFLGLLALMLLWETAAPRRRPTLSKWVRWLNNLGMVGLYTILVRLIFPLLATGVAALAVERDWGLFNNIELPGWLAVVGSVVVLDFAIYLQHVMMHAVPLFWRLHRMHHADLDYDTTTGIRFHPLEIIVSMVIKLALVAALGPPVVAVIIFEVVLNGMALFNHGNVRLPLALDRVLRWVFVTPDMHRVHHSIDPLETNSNYGFNLAWWDRLMGTYRAQPAQGHEGMTIGLEEFRDPGQAWLHQMLVQPLRGGTGAYPLGAGRRE